MPVTCMPYTLATLTPLKRAAQFTKLPLGEGSTTLGLMYVAFFCISATVHISFTSAPELPFKLSSKFVDFLNPYMGR
jgi:hypothetical protein